MHCKETLPKIIMLQMHRLKARSLKLKFFTLKVIQVIAS